MALSESSRASSLCSSSEVSIKYAPSSPVMSSASGSSSSSKLSLDDEENVTITASHSMNKKLGKQKSQDDLRLLAVSTHMTEMSYSISDIQTRIFEIQELRHKSQATGDTAGTTSIIDQSLMNLDERLEAVSKGMKSISDSLEPLLRTAATPTISQNGSSNENAAILRKHATLVGEWEAVQDESDVLREELKEDKWLTVFRTVTDQADGMMSSLEKAVNRCQDFIWQVHRRGHEDSSAYTQSTTSLSASHRSEKPPLNFDVFNSLLDSFEAKKKHYMPATSKVLSIIDKGVQDRVTKNGETLRRHAESAQRWKNLRDRISRTDAEMERVRKILLSVDSAASENGSSTSGTTSMSMRNGYLATPPSGQRSSRAPSASSTLSRSISPFRKFARKIAGSAKQPPVTPLSINKNNQARAPVSEPIPTLRRQRTSIFTFHQPPTPVTPERPSHKYSQSLTPDSSPRVQKADPNSTIKNSTLKQRWNSSTRVEPEDRAGTLKATPPRRTPSSTGMYGSIDTIPPLPTGNSYKRSLSRSSMGSSRPWSPVTSSNSTAFSQSPMPIPRPPSRTQAPSRAITPGLGTVPRPRPKTPSHIPAPAKWRNISGLQSEGSADDDENHMSLMQRAFSPTFSTSAMSSGSGAHPPRPPSRSMIPIPSLHFSSSSRPSSAMSQYRSESPTSSSFRTSAARAQTPESALKARAQQITFFPGSSTGTTPARTTARPSLQNKLPPSSFRDGSTSRTPSRPSSRSGAYTPVEHPPLHEYVPNAKDPLDAEVATIVNSIAHGLFVERVDPPLRVIPKDGEEIRAQYAFANALSRKVVTCRLTTMSRASKSHAGGDAVTKKVMCRVGGGWQDLQLYMLNRQAGM